MIEEQIKKREGKGILAYSVLFLMIAGIGYFPFFLERRSLIWQLDGIGQYYPAFLYIGKYLRTLVRGLLGGAPVLPLFDLSIGLGEDIIGSLNYYGFGDPVNLLAVFATTRNGAIWFTACTVLRMWAAGLAFMYFCKKHGIEWKYALPAVLCYVFSGFSVLGGARYNEWLSVLIYLPLMLAGAERLMRGERKPLLFSVSVAYGALCGFYYLYMASLVLAVYCLVRLFSLYGKNEPGQIMKRTAVCIGWYLTGILLAAPILVPALAAYFGSERSGGQAAFALSDIRNFIPSWETFLDHVKEILFFRNEYIDRGYLAGITLTELLAVPSALFLCGKARKRQLAVSWGLALFLLALPLTGYLFNAFGETNTRWQFCLHALAAYTLAAAAEAMAGRLKAAGKADVRWNCFLYLLTAANLVFFLLFTFSEAGMHYTDRFVTVMEADRYTDSPVRDSEVISADPDLFRVGTTTLYKLNQRPENVAMLRGYYGVRYWFSMINRHTQELVDLVTGHKSRWRSFGLRENVAADTLYGIKYYIVGKTRYAPEGWSLTETFRFYQDKWYVFENPDYCGMAFLLPSGSLSGEETAETLFLRMEQSLKQNREEEILETDYDNLRGRFRGRVSASEDSSLLVSIPYSKNWRLRVDGKSAAYTLSDTGMILIDLPRGEHEIVLRYRYNNLLAGLAGFAAGVLLLACGRRKGKNERSK